MKNKELTRVIVSSCIFTLGMTLCGFVFLGIKTGVAILITNFVLLSLFYFFTKRRYKKIKELNEYLTRVTEENDSLEAIAEEDGELSELKNNLNKAISALKSQKETLSEEK